MVLTVVSPFGDDETRSKGIEQLLEDWLESVWNVTDVPASDVKFGQKVSGILQGGTPIVLRCYVYSSLTDRMDVSGQIWTNRDAVQIDVWVSNNNTNLASREPRAIKIMTFLKDLFIINQGNMPKGIFQVDLLSANIQEDPFKNNLTHVIIKVRLTYNWNIVNI